MSNAIDFEHLPIAKKLELVTQLWDQIAMSTEPILLPDPVIAEAERRLDEVITDPSITISEEQMWQQANAKRK